MMRGVVVTGPLTAPLRLLVVFAVACGLLAAVPAACWCPPDEHFGQLLHPLFAHSHASGHSAADAADAAEADSTVTAAGPSWASASGLGAGEWQGGIQILPPLPVTFHPDIIGPRFAFDADRPAQHLPGPPFPPPR